jgi:hypothetical protein
MELLVKVKIGEGTNLEKKNFLLNLLRHISLFLTTTARKIQMA